MSMSVLGIVVTGILSIAIWHAVASNHMTAHMNTILIIAAVVETLLLLASVLGLTGAIARKQLFIAMYTYFLYAHFLLNVGVAGYLLWMITHSEQSDVVKACQEAITNQQAQSQCTGLLEITKTIFLVVGFIVLFTELYGALIATRYLLQLKGEKRTVRNSRLMARQSRLSGYASLGSSDFGSGPRSKEFDPYAHYRDESLSASLSGTYMELSEDSKIPPVHDDEEAGYGGGVPWTHEQISQYEKSVSPEPEVAQAKQEPAIVAPIARPARGSINPEALLSYKPESPKSQSESPKVGSRVSFSLPSSPDSRAQR
ncbi:hypothetical protein OE88DRAFT_1655070 [Heliocybe sulcata]|uniref:Uncharacterized protein n=1 Tax=Heliocybe sulcata TaxID=5364 RepID=A0A5C3NEF3_9AGAM|nr:hypothetical protein OE88DRAFT_1655070 [Heliocybe sulcata]